jgi:hypothetical protein
MTRSSKAGGKPAGGESERSGSDVRLLRHGGCAKFISVEFILEEK